MNTKIRMGAVHELVREVWKAREAGGMKRDARDLSRGLALSVATEVKENEGYDPEQDARVVWLREMIADMRRAPRWRIPKASVDSEYAVLFLLGPHDAVPCGRGMKEES